MMIEVVKVGDIERLVTVDAGYWDDHGESWRVIITVMCCWIFFYSSPILQHQNVIDCFTFLNFFSFGDCATQIPNKSHMEA